MHLTKNRKSTNNCINSCSGTEALEAHQASISQKLKRDSTHHSKSAQKKIKNIQCLELESKEDVVKTRSRIKQCLSPVASHKDFRDQKIFAAKKDLKPSNSKPRKSKISRSSSRNKEATTISTYKQISEQLGKSGETSNFAYLDHQGLTFRNRRTSKHNEASHIAFPKSNKHKLSKQTLTKNTEQMCLEAEQYSQRVLMAKKKPPRLSIKTPGTIKAADKNESSRRQRFVQRDIGFVHSVHGHYSELQLKYFRQKDHSMEKISRKALLCTSKEDSSHNEANKNTPISQIRLERDQRNSVSSFRSKPKLANTREKNPLLPKDFSRKIAVDSPSREAHSSSQNGFHSKFEACSPSFEIPFSHPLSDLHLHPKIPPTDKPTASEAIDRYSTHEQFVARRDVPQTSKHKSKSKSPLTQPKPPSVSKKDILKILKMHRQLRARVFNLQSKLRDTHAVDHHE